LRHLREALPLVWHFHERAVDSGDAILVVDLRARDLEIPEEIELAGVPGEYEEIADDVQCIRVLPAKGYFMSEQTKTKEILDTVLDNSIDLTDNKISYVNIVRFQIGANEITLDMYFLSASSKVSDKSPQAQRIHRVVMPLGAAKEVAQLLLDGISQWEDTFG